jgi:7-cyano-7-deazaguanine reductase
MAHSLLGGDTTYVNQYDPSQLFPVSRETGRQTLGLSSADLPFEGFDLWNAYEFTYLTHDGVPRQLALRLWIPIQSPSLIESKSMKLYLGSFAGSRFESESEVIETIARDLSEALGLGQAALETEQAQRPPELVVRVLCDADLAVPSRPEGWICLDREIPEQITFDYSPSLLRVASNRAASEVLYSDGFRSLCPVTGQPDFARIVLGYEGTEVDRAALLAYLLSYREHGDFAEQVAERLFVDLARAFSPSALWVRAEFTRRGGIDINTERFAHCEPWPYQRHPRQ